MKPIVIFQIIMLMVLAFLLLALDIQIEHLRSDYEQVNHLNSTQTK